MKKNSKKIPGFTLIELLVTIAIIAILSGISIYGLSAIRNKAQDTSKLSTLREVEIALEAYKSVNGKYPTTSYYSTASADPTYFASTFIKKIPTPDTEYTYVVSADYKSYCFNVRGTIYKPESQPDLNDTVHTKSWQTCKGPLAASLTSQ